MKDVYIIGSYSTQLKKWPEKSFKDLTRDAYLGVLEDAGPRQVKGAALALQENGGGIIGLEESACSVIILQKDR